MSKQFNYRVFPTAVVKSEVLPDSSPIVLTKAQQKDASGWSGTAVAIGLFVGALITACLLFLAISTELVDETILGDRPVPIFVMFCLFSVIGIPVTARQIEKRRTTNLKWWIREERNNDYQRRKRSAEEAYKRDVENSKREAQRLTSELTNLLTSSVEEASRLPQWLANSATELTRAENDYTDHAYSPFWDAIEQVAKDLASFSRTTQHITQSASKYYSTLKNRHHNFPGFPIRVETFPDPMPITNEFRRLVRLGQTNFEFANIWEHRRTRDVFIVGFQSLGDAVNRLGVTVENSVRSLQKVTESNLALLIDEQMESRLTLATEAKKQTEIAKEQSRMLDNIQHHRKPSF